MEVKLVVLSGSKPGQVIPVAGPEFLIGRADDCQLRPRSDMISRRHCAVLLEEGSVKIKDFGSKNGTYVNGQKVENERDLKNGDRLKVGPLEFDVQLAVSVGGKKKPKVHSVKEAAARTVQTAGDDLDISSWLEDDDDDTVNGTISADKPLFSPATARADSAETSVPPPAHPEKKDDDTQVVGRYQTGKPAAAACSRDAAANMLKQFFHRKP
jgi:predicted component of type VI protein secretion system